MYFKPPFLCLENGNKHLPSKRPFQGTQVPKDSTLTPESMHKADDDSLSQSDSKWQPEVHCTLELTENSLHWATSSSSVAVFTVGSKPSWANL